MKVIATIYQMLGWKVGQDSIQKFNTTHFIASIPYFASHSDDLDPFGCLGELGQSMHHNKDNRMAYMRQDMDTEM